ncbi:DUF3096 domain-containing protein [Candidatus Uabimicrobium sp. HlEnr_7]|uniref:DUF3096 domain-containing protein n=1 Tax=Candidatus Uabimicrobium helgolandensis TaxID=3095367 RepID=UPI003556C490
MPKRIRMRQSQQVTSVLYIVVGVMILIRPDIAMLLLAVFLIVVGALGLLT